jgi:hypothetical protein
LSRCQNFAADAATKKSGDFFETALRAVLINGLIRGQNSEKLFS